MEAGYKYTYGHFLHIVSFGIRTMNPTYISASHYFHQFQIPFTQRMHFIKYQGSDQCHLLCSVCHIFTTQTRIFLSIQLLLNKKFFHQSNLKFIKTFSISPASICAILFIKVGGKVLDPCRLMKGIIIQSNWSLLALFYVYAAFDMVTHELLLQICWGKMSQENFLMDLL